MNALATVQGQLSSAQSLAWNPVSIPPSLLTAEISDVAICALIEESNSHLQYAALRYAPREAMSASAVFVDQFLLTMKSVGGWPKEVKWTRHAAEGSKQYLGLISYSYTIDEDSAAPTRIAFYDAYVVVGSLAGQLIKKPQTPLPINCSNTHGYIGSMAVPADTQITAWQPDGRWSNTIAVGCADGSVYFGDLSALKPNEILMLDQDSCPAAISVNQGPILSLAWHHQAMSRDILLVGGAAGFAIVHTRNLKILMAPSDTHKRKNVSGVCWLENGNSVAVTYNDETASVPTGVLQLWDLRRCTHPYKEIPAHHQSGVIGLMRSSIDSRFFCTVSNDGRVVTWATFGSNAVPYSEASVQQPCRTFSLLPCTGLLCVLTQSQVFIVSLDSHVITENLKFSPQWLQSGNALAFGFGGKLAYLRNCLNPVSGQLECSAGICDLPCDDTFVEAVDEFVKYLASNDLAGYCRMRSQEADNLGDPYEADIWSLLAAAFANPNERIHLLLKVLGYSANNIQSQAQAFLGHPAGEGVIKNPETRNPNLQTSGLGSSINTIGQEDSPTEHEAASFFDKLACTTNNNENDGSVQNSNKMVDMGTGEMLTSKTGYVVDRDWSSGPLKLLKDLFLIGQPLGAIEFALQANDFGLAFMIACSLDNKMVLQTIKEKFIEFNKQSFIRVIAQSSEDDFEAIVNCCEDPSEEWKEIASILITYPMMQEVAMSGTTVEYHRLCCMLAQRLAEDGDLMSAIPCYLVAGAYSQAAKLIANLPSTAGSQALKIIILRCLINQTTNVTEPDAQSAQVVQLFLTRLVNSGHIEQSTSLLNLIGHDFPGTSQLRSLIDETRGGATAPAVVYQPIYDVQPAPSYLAQTQQAQYQRASTQPVVMPQQPGIMPSAQRGMMPPPLNPMAMSMGSLPPTGLNLGLTASLPPSSMQSIPNPYAPPNSMTGAPVMPPSIQQKPLMAPQTIPGMSQMPPPPPNMHQQMPSPPTAIPSFTNPPPPPTSNPPAAANTFTPPRPGFSANPHTNPQQATFVPQASNVFAPPAAQLRSNPQMPPSVPTGFGGGVQPPQMYGQQQTQPPQVPSLPNIPHMPNMMAGPRMMSPSIPALPDPPHMLPPSGPPATTSAFQLASNAARPIAGSDEWSKSTHPAACVGGHIQPGMPTPWPLPTPSQGGRTAASEQFIQQVRDASRPSGATCTPADLNKIRSALDLAITRIPDATKQPQVRTAVQELYTQLNEMDLSAEAIEQLSQFADALNSQNFMMAKNLAQVMISTSWKKNSRNWLTALKKLANSGTYQAAQASF